MPAQDKPMKIYYQQINGRNVPVYYPQYFDEALDDWVISSVNDPLPIGGSVGVNNLPADYPDSAALTELQAVNSNLKGTINTQLTGRNVELTSLLGATLTAGASNFILIDADQILTDYSKIYVTVRADATHDWEVPYSFRVLGSAVTDISNVWLTGNKLAGATNHTEVKGEGLRLGLFNNDSVSHTYDIHLFGVK